jgi:hypothetical protein
MVEGQNGSHSSAPPPRALARVRAGPLSADDSVSFFCVEGAPPESCRTRTDPDGSLTFSTRLSGPVLEVVPDALVVARGPHRVRLRHLLPSLVDLSRLRGHTVGVELSQRYGRRGRATIDCVLRDADAGLVLWARDGRLPEDRESHGLALRALMTDGAPRLAVGDERGVHHLRPPSRQVVHRRGERSELLLTRLGSEDLSIVLVGR